MNAPARSANWIIIVPLAVVTGLYVYFIFVPGRRTFADLRDQVKTKQAAIADAGELTKSIRLAREEIEKTQAYVAACQKRLPAERDLGRVLGKIHELANQAGLRVTRFDPQPVVAYEQLRRVPCTIGCSGSFEQIYEFLRTLESTSSAIWVESLKMEKDGKARKNIQCETILEVFVDNSETSDYAKASD